MKKFLFLLMVSGLTLFGIDSSVFPLEGTATTIILVYPEGDIVKLPVQAVVNAANGALSHGGGVCGALFRAAGAAQLRDYIFKNKLGPIAEGQAVITPSFNILSSSARTITSIIHAVGPRYIDGYHDEARTLFNAYYNSLELAEAHALCSIAFPFISAGIFGYPLKEAARVAINAVATYAQKNPNSSVQEIYFAFPTKEHGQLFHAILEKK